MISPGPWEVRMGEEEYHEADRVYGIYSADGECIVETDTGVYGPEIDDARLIAQAPTMRDWIIEFLDLNPLAAGTVDFPLLAKARAILKAIDG